MDRHELALLNRKRSCTPYSLLLPHGDPSLRRDHNFLPQHIIVSENLPHDHIRSAIRNSVRGVLGIDAHAVGCFEDDYGFFLASPSLLEHMAPGIGTKMGRAQGPSCLYSTVLAPIDGLR